MGSQSVGHDLAANTFIDSFLKFIYFWLHLIFIAVWGLSLVVESRDYSIVAVLWLLTVVASFVVEHRF